MDLDYADPRESDDNVQNAFAVPVPSTEESTTRFAQAAIATEELLARNFGRETNYMILSGTQDEQEVMFESAGHHMMGHMHDLANVAESSLLNSENTVGQIEARSLGEPLQPSPLEPWELQAVHLTTGRPYERLAEMFLEEEDTNYPGYREEDQEEEQVQEPEPLVTCEQCSRLVSKELLDAKRQGLMVDCDFCGDTKIPINSTEDPDTWNVIHGVESALDFCHCRCNCETGSLDMMSPTFEAEPATQEAAPQQATVAAAPRPPPRRQVGLAINVVRATDLADYDEYANHADEEMNVDHMDVDRMDVDEMLDNNDAEQITGADDVDETNDGNDDVEMTNDNGDEEYIYHSDSENTSDGEDNRWSGYSDSEAPTSPRPAAPTLSTTRESVDSYDRERTQPVVPEAQTVPREVIQPVPQVLMRAGAPTPRPAGLDNRERPQVVVPQRHMTPRGLFQQAPEALVLTEEPVREMTDEELEQQRLIIVLALLLFGAAWFWACASGYLDDK